MPDDEENIACPVCGFKLPTADLPGQKAHLEANHPEVIEQRLRDAGFEKDAEGNWYDLLAAD